MERKFPSYDITNFFLVAPRSAHTCTARYLERKFPSYDITNFFLVAPRSAHTCTARYLERKFPSYDITKSPLPSLSRKWCFYLRVINIEG
ncbi:ORF1177 [White spot syndrome virus]|uniref:ORF1177 n=1 Tax=White spot syndrome virus TaxID=342409 RepID=A0A2D3I5U3_9VIRU|nr:ORF1177 [White spot syndrome virus]